MRVFSALPARALRGRPPLMAASLVVAVSVLGLFGAMLAVPVAIAPPVLLTDWQVRREALYVRGGTARDSSCTSQDSIEMCTMTLSAPVGAGRVERQVGYAFLSAGTRRAYRVVADPAHPEWLTTDVGLELFWNRVAFLAGATGVLGVLLWLLVRIGMHRYRQQRMWRTKDALAVRLRLLSRQAMAGGQIWTVQGDDGPPERWTVPRKAAPFVVGAASEILGLRLLDGTAVMPLDSRLRWVRLTRSERELVLGPAKR